MRFTDNSMSSKLKSFLSSEKQLLSRNSSDSKSDSSNESVSKYKHTDDPHKELNSTMHSMYETPDKKRRYYDDSLDTTYLNDNQNILVEAPNGLYKFGIKKENDKSKRENSILGEPP